MNVCSNKDCTNWHDTKFKQCESCRLDARNYRRKNGGYRIGKILEICENEKDNEVSKKIMNVIGVD